MRSTQEIIDAMRALEVRPAPSSPAADTPQAAPALPAPAEVDESPTQAQQVAQRRARRMKGAAP